MHSHVVGLVNSPSEQANSSRLPHYAQTSTQNHTYPSMMQNDLPNRGRTFGTNGDGPNADWRHPPNNHDPPCQSVQPPPQLSRPLLLRDHDHIQMLDHSSFVDRIPLQGHYYPPGDHNGQPDFPPAMTFNG